MNELSRDNIVEILIFYKNKLSESEFEYLQLQIKHKVEIEKIKQICNEEILKKENYYLEINANTSLNYQEKIKLLTKELESLKKKQFNKTIKDKEKNILNKTAKNK